MFTSSSKPLLVSKIVSHDHREYFRLKRPPSLFFLKENHSIVFERESDFNKETTEPCFCSPLPSQDLKDLVPTEDQLETRQENLNASCQAEKSFKVVSLDSAISVCLM
eukprot:TRINITY_DN40318_c0_g1_i1.p2 TRINITY_DN40318_c0_g1~~TRINITY_DN40318_c0_g1_i1.p2  ORF type:complete len:108 (+),score=9.30 TRINITY_DN40318_c0_g1_i1:179-502(+)